MIEVVLPFHYIAETLLNEINSELYLLKACHSNRTVVDRSYKSCDNDDQRWTFHSETTSFYYRWPVYIVCILYVTMATSWSDLSGRRRRPLIFLPIFGKILQSISGFTHWYFWSWSPIAAFNTNKILELIGGMNMIFVAAQIYICDMSAVENRTMRLILLWALRTSCIFVSSRIARKLMPTDGFFYWYAICFVLSVISMMFTAFLVEDIPDVPAKKLGFLQLFDFNRIVNSFKVVFKKTLGSKRLLVLLLMVVYVAVYSTYQGEKATELLFITSRIRSLSDGPSSSHWDTLFILKNLTVIFDALFCSIVLSKCLQMRDVSIGIFGIICNILGVTVYFLADEIWHLYLATVINVFHWVVLFATVSCISKFYEGNEFGRLFGVLNILWTIVLLSGSIYAVVSLLTI